MDLGAFSMSLAVKDIHESKAFYAKLGFAEMGGDIEQGWVILKNRGHILGLFQGMFESNIMTFNPGWDQDAQNVPDFDDVREIAEALRADGLPLTQEEGLDGDGVGSFMITDPDGNVILIDQHRPRA